MQYEARKANQVAIVAEKRKSESTFESRGVSKEKWLEDRKKKIGKLLDSNGLDLKKAYMLDTQEAAAGKNNREQRLQRQQRWFAKRKFCKAAEGCLQGW